MLSKRSVPQLSCILVDNGLLRRGEVETVIEEFSNHFDRPARGPPKTNSHGPGRRDQPAKRRLIGHAFIDCWPKRPRSKTPICPRTLYPDVIESGGSVDGPADDQAASQCGRAAKGSFVRVDRTCAICSRTSSPIGLQLGLPEDIVCAIPSRRDWRSLRRRGDQAASDTLRGRRIVVEEIKAAGLYRKTSRFAVLLPCRRRRDGRRPNVRGRRCAFDRVRIL